MKLNKKGFTMIELLATIVILSILGVIGVTSTTKYLKQSKQKSYKMMSETVYEATMNCMVQGKCETPTSAVTPTTYTTANLIDLGYLRKLENPGRKNSVCEGSVNVYLTGSSQTEYKNFNYEVNLNCPGLSNATLVWPYSKTADNKEINKIIESSATNSTAMSNSISLKKDYSVGDAINYNPVEGKACAYGEGCYTWYVIKTSSSTDTTVSVMLDHNIGDKVKAMDISSSASVFSVAPNVNYAINYLRGLTSTWKNTPRIMTVAEVTSIYGLAATYSNNIDIGDKTWLAAANGETYWLDNSLNYQSNGYGATVSNTGIFFHTYLAYNGYFSTYNVRPVIDITK